MRCTIKDLFIYPIKSTRGIRLDHSNVQECGLAFDRHFVVTDSSGKFITGRSKAKMVLITTELSTIGIRLNAPGMNTLTLSYLSFSNDYHPVKVWQDELKGQHCSADADTWLSEYLGTDCRLYYFGPNSVRHVANTAHPVSFADGYPLLLLSRASLQDLNRRCPDLVSMQQFRPNIVVEGCAAFAEDSWHKIRIGDVEFLVSKPCSRCIFTTVDPNSATRHQLKEPLATLSEYRRGNDGQIYFGQNIIPLNSGHIKVDDEVEVLAVQATMF
ncbi:MOSC domain-containing protein [Thalassotalea mangrovi]|uniref:MOSC domain-containing protein n=1 Tax=Thalassotalea mangrovi TaxID=2572245 RepID=A0A4U1B2Y8_9GAMM|nr:MOSC domain-containing protein [Thalassotalea mangrovi]TKB43962.1 MOSC domain-containing protein [Thalassotalea mangrovi]